MLPRGSRVRTRQEHALVGRSGRRVRAGSIVVHSVQTDVDGPPRAGFVVGRRVGNAVVRNRVRRRLREQTRSRLSLLPPGTAVLIRALPDAAGSSSADLGRSLESAFRTVRSPRPQRSARSG
ncbi:ribonuclease P protein component [Frankia sp. Mgl5]|uniref:ribonuclease P protein component n=1 Tax=Frankia sp. Mgl5 TaxID=2933793 RepID=UPI00200F5E7E|nr:ribonuclease P protein component [Frankia sp. Mgl5]MCK9930080.1 ribonuclease P protein component [Frankia sp. Mgl5]